MCTDAGKQSADGVADNSLAGEVAALEACHHGNMVGQITAPAHSHGGENGNVLGPSAADSFFPSIYVLASYQWF